MDGAVGQPNGGATAASGTLGAAAIAAELGKLGTSPKGLSADEAKARLEKYGRNAIEAREESRWSKLLGYFWGPLPWMIEAAALISLLRRDWPDFAVVTGLLLYNAAIGFWQDNKAANALAALKKGLALKARALRGGQWLSIDAAELVPGDVVTVSAGEIVPADLLLIDGEYLSVDQAALTGESLPVEQARRRRRLFRQHRQAGLDDRRGHGDRQPDLSSGGPPSSSPRPAPSRIRSRPCCRSATS